MPNYNEYSSKELENEKQRILLAITDAEDILSSLRANLNLLSEELSKRTAPAIEPKVTDHALLRYIERVKGFDVESLKKEILTDAVLNGMKLGASSVKTNGMKLVLKGNAVVTIT